MHHARWFANVRRAAEMIIALHKYRASRTRTHAVFKKTLIILTIALRVVHPPLKLIEFEVFCQEQIIFVLLYWVLVSRRFQVQAGILSLFLVHVHFISYLLLTNKYVAF